MRRHLLVAAPLLALGLALSGCAGQGRRVRRRSPPRRQRRAGRGGRARRRATRTRRGSSPSACASTASTCPTRSPTAPAGREVRRRLADKVAGDDQAKVEAAMEACQPVAAQRRRAAASSTPEQLEQAAAVRQVHARATACRTSPTPIRTAACGIDARARRTRVDRRPDCARPLEKCRGHRRRRSAPSGGAGVKRASPHRAVVRRRSRWSRVARGRRGRRRVRPATASGTPTRGALPPATGRGDPADPGRHRGGRRRRSATATRRRCAARGSGGTVTWLPAAGADGRAAARPLYRVDDDAGGAAVRHAARLPRRCRRASRARTSSSSRRTCAALGYGGFTVDDEYTVGHGRRGRASGRRTSA